MSGHVTPIASIRIGIWLGHLKLPPEAAPTDRKTPNPGCVTKPPFAVKPKLRASPPIARPPTVTCAEADANETISWSPVAPVSIVKPLAETVRNEPRWILSVSDFH